MDYDGNFDEGWHGKSVYINTTGTGDKDIDYEPFYDYKNLEYCITVTTKHFNFSSNTMNQEALLEGVEKLLTYYNRRLFDDFNSNLKERKS